MNNVMNFINGNYTIILLQDFLYAVAIFIPTLVLVLIISVIGYFIAVILEKIIVIVLKKIKFDQVFKKAIGEETIKKAEWKVIPSVFIASIIKWILVIIVLSIVTEMLGIVQFVAFLYTIMNFSKAVIVSLLIFIITLFIVEYLSKIIRIWAEGMKVEHGRGIALLVKIIIWKFAIFAILIELGVTEELVTILFKGTVAFLAVAGGLAFGLAGKDIATKILKDFYQKLKE